MEENNRESDLEKTKLAIAEDSSNANTGAKNEVEAMEYDPDVQKDDTYRIFDYFKANPVLTVAVISGAAAVMTLFLNLVVFIVGWKEQELQGLSFYSYSDNNQWYYFALISLLMTTILSLYSFLAADAGKVISYNNTMHRYEKEYIRYLKTYVDEEKNAFKTIRKELRKERRKEKKQKIKQEFRFPSSAESILENAYDRAKSSIKEISDIRLQIAKSTRSVIFSSLSETITLFLLYVGVSFLYFSLLSNELLAVIIPTLTIMTINISLLVLSCIFGAMRERVPKCTKANVDDFRTIMTNYMKRAQRKGFTKRLVEKGFRAFFPDRIVFQSARSIVTHLTITCIVVAFMMAFLPQAANKFRITEYEDKTYIVVAKNDNNYALIEAEVICGNSLEVHRGLERYITTEDINIVTKTFKNVEWINSDN